MCNYRLVPFKIYVVGLECSYIINFIEKYEMMHEKSLALMCALEVF